MRETARKRKAADEMKLWRQGVIRPLLDGGKGMDDQGKWLECGNIRGDAQTTTNDVGHGRVQKHRWVAPTTDGTYDCISYCSCLPLWDLAPTFTLILSILQVETVPGLCSRLMSFLSCANILYQGDI